MAWLARLGFAAVLAFAATLLALHAATDEDPQHLSGYVHTAWGPVWIASLAAFALGAFAISVELRRTLAIHPMRRVGLFMLWLSAFGALILAASPVDADPYRRTTLGLIHQDTAPPTFLLAAGAMLAFAPAFRSAHGWRRMAGLSVACGLFAFGLAIAYVAATLAGDPAAGGLQRLLVGVIVAWMLAVTVRLLRGPPRHARPGSPDGPRPSCTV
jgi:hypothetical protein